MSRKRKSKRLSYESEDERREENEFISRRLRKNATNVQKEDVHTGFLHVICGTKKGILDVGKLEKHEPCIQCEGRLLTPNAFETFGGKGHFKKWKMSIFFDGKPLNCLLEQGHLLPKGYERSGTAEDAKVPSVDTHSEESMKDDVNKSSESENKEAEQLGEADRNEEEMKNGVVSCDDVLTAANPVDNKKTQESERTSIMSTPVKHICTHIVKVVLRRLSQDRLHQIKRSVSQEKQREEEPNSLDTPLSEAETGDLSINNNNNNNELPVADVSCEPLKESSQQAEEQKDPSAADEDRSKAASTDPSPMEEDGQEQIEGKEDTISDVEKNEALASTDSSPVEEDGQELMESNDSAQILEEIPPTTCPCDSSPPELMEPQTSEKEDIISDVEKNEALDVSCEPLKESSQQAEEQKDPSAADEDRSEAASIDPSPVEEDGQEPIESNDSAQNLEEILPTCPCDSSPAELMEPQTSEKEDTISDVEKNDVLGPSTKSSVELENSSPTENPIIISSELKTLELNTCIDQTSVDDCSTNMEEDSLTNVTESVNVDGMGLEQLKKEKVKMQLKVLRLREEYYKLKMRKLKE